MEKSTDDLNREIPEVDQLISRAEQTLTISLDSAILYSSNALKKSESENYEKGIAGSKAILGQIAFAKGDFKRANTYLIKALQIFKRYERPAKVGKIYNLLGQVYEYSQQPELSFKNYWLAYQEYKAINDLSGLAETYGFLGHFHEKDQTYDSALWYQKKALGIYEQQNDKSGIARTYDNVGSIYEDLGQYPEALQNFEEAYRINKKTGNEVEALVNLNNIGDIHRKTGFLQKALSVTHQVLQKAKSQNLIYQIRSAYRDLGKVYQDMGKHHLSYAYLDSCYKVNGEIYNQEIAREIADTRALYELAQKEQQISLLEKDQKIDQFYLSGVIIGSVLLLIIAGLVFRHQRIRIKKNQALYNAEKHLNQANEEKLKAELEYTRLYEEKLEQEIKNKSRELTTNALQVIRKNEFLENLINDLKKAEKGMPAEFGKKIKKIRKSIDYNFSLDDDWQEFESVFQNIHQEFFNQLRQQFPDLTSADIRLCAMLRLNLNSQEIAAIMGISQDSLRIARYRLRKKIGISKGGNLYSYIMTIG